MPRLLTAVMDVATNKVEKFAYKPWGMRRNPANWAAEVVNDYPARFSRGYCMHEHLSNLGLINMGGRVYNARTNQFISPDPYRQAPDSWLNCNRFGYCMGNPVMYTDPDGELWWLIPAIAAIVGGTANLVSNWDNIDGFWQGFASFGVGAAAGFGTACAFTFGGPAAGMFAATGTGAITAATNNIIGQTGRNFEGFSNIDVQSVWKSAGRGALIAGISSMAGCYGSQLGSSLFSGISSPILQSGLVGMTAGLASGLAGGSMAAGLYQDPNLIWQSSLLGACLGFAIPATYSGIQSARMGINPWTGELKLEISKVYDMKPSSNAGENVTLYRGTTGSEGKNGYLFMTDDWGYAQSYVKNGGSVEQVTLPKSVLYQMANDGTGNLQISNPQIHTINGVEYMGREYIFSPQVKGLITPLF